MSEESKEVHYPKTGKFNPANILIGLLIVASFVIGSLWTKVKYLEKGSATTGTQLNAGGNNADNGAAAQPQAPQATAKKPELTKEDYIRGNKNAKVTLVEY